jgi:hypothetical protein
MMADSRSLLGARPLLLISPDWSPVMIPPICVFFQSLFVATTTLFPSRISKVGLGSASEIPN